MRKSEMATIALYTALTLQLIIWLAYVIYPFIR